MTGVVVLPFIVVVITKTGRSYLPQQDFAVIDLRVRDVWSSHVPLLGPWSREGWSHPGPLFYWLLAIPYGLAGEATWSLIVGGALIQAGAIIACARLAWVRGRLTLTLLVLAAISLAYGTTEAFSVIAPWNPNIAYPFYPLFLLLVWSVAVGEVKRLPWATAIGTFLVQTHVGYLPLVVVGAVCAGSFVLNDTRRDPERRRAALRYATWSLALGTLLWMPAIIDQLFGTGNLRAMASYFLHSNEKTAGLKTGAGTFAEEFRVLPPWLGGKESFEKFTSYARPASLWWLTVPAALLVIAGAAARRFGESARRRLVVLVAVASGTAIVAMAQVRGARFAYLFPWRVFIAVFVVVAFGYALVPLVRKFDRRAALVLPCLGLLALIGVSSGMLASDTASYGTLDIGGFASTSRYFLRKAEHDVRGAGTVLVRPAGVSPYGLTSTLMDQLDRHGTALRVDRALAYQFGEQRIASPQEVDSIWFVSETGWITSELVGAPGAKVVARTRKLPPRLEDELAALQRKVRGELADAKRTDLFTALDNPYVIFLVDQVPGVDRAATFRIGQLNAQADKSSTACRCAIVAIDPHSSAMRTLTFLGT